MDEYGGPAAPPRPPKPAARVHRGGGGGALLRARGDERAAGGGVSLLRPRPEAERERNAYVEAPRRAAAPPPPPPPPHAPLKPVTAQPGARGADAHSAGADKAFGESILCARCGRCRCGQCARGRALPARWLCGSCLCSAEACVDYASCMCCVKALLYHCGEEEAGDVCAGGARAAGVAALALPLPCLLLYWPLRACAAAGAALWARAGRTGCRCPDPVPAPRLSII